MSRKAKLYRIFEVTCLLAYFSLRVSAAEFRITSADELQRDEDLPFRPGDIVIMADGEWRDERIVFRGQGTAVSPITLRAETPGGVILTGRSSLVIDGEHLVVSGLHLKDGTDDGDGVSIAGNHCRLTDSAITGGRYKFFVHLFGFENRLDHCYLADKTSESPTIQVAAEGSPNRHRIDNNYFGHRPPLGRNGGETIRVGNSWSSMTSSGTLVERNLFQRCDGENEIISSKSCDNIYRENTFRECAGMLTLRHGNRCRVEGNFFLGNHKRGSGGVRIIGDDHILINNYIEGVREGAFWITAGIPNSEPKGYFQARNCMIAFNTVIDSRGPYLDLSAGLNSSRRRLRPRNITVANNLFALDDPGALVKGQEGVGWAWMGNAITQIPEDAGADDSDGELDHRFRTINAMLDRAGDGLWRPGSDSHLRGAAVGGFPAVRTDIDGQPRESRLDIGCDQFSESSVVNRPLSASDVGPAWRRVPGE